MLNAPRRHWFVAASLSVVAAVILLRVFDPASAAIFPPCPLHYLTGLYCPGCGSLRAIHQLLQGNLQAAWAMNPLTLVLLPFIGYGLASEALLQLRGLGLPQPMLAGASIYTLCAVIILFGILRNIPLYPFGLLAPGALLNL